MHTYLHFKHFSFSATPPTIPANHFWLHRAERVYIFTLNHFRHLKFDTLSKIVLHRAARIHENENQLCDSFMCLSGANGGDECINEWMNEWGSDDRDQSIHFATYTLLDIFRFDFSPSHQESHQIHPGYTIWCDQWVQSCWIEPTKNWQIERISLSVYVMSGTKSKVKKVQNVSIFILNWIWWKTRRKRKQDIENIVTDDKLFGASGWWLLIHIYRRDRARPNPKSIFQHCSASARTIFTCASATSSLDRLKNIVNIDRNLEATFVCFFFLFCVVCARALSDFCHHLSLAHTLNRKHHIHASNNSHTATGSTKCSQNMCIISNRRKKNIWSAQISYSIIPTHSPQSAFNCIFATNATKN